MNQMQPSGKPQFEVIEDTAEKVSHRINNMLRNQCAVQVISMSTCCDAKGTVTTSVLVLWDKLIDANPRIVPGTIVPPNLRGMS